LIKDAAKTFHDNKKSLPLTEFLKDEDLKKQKPLNFNLYYIF